MHNVHRHEQEIAKTCIQACEACIVACEALHDTSTSISTSSYEEEQRTEHCLQACNTCIKSLNNFSAALQKSRTACKDAACRIDFEAYSAQSDKTIKSCGKLAGLLKAAAQDLKPILEEVIADCDSTAELCEQFLQ